MSFDAKAFRNALGCFPTGIAVVTTSSEETSHIGITVNSFTSVSLDPPLVLWCIDRRSRRYPAFANAPGFTVSILASGHRSVSSRLAGAASLLPPAPGNAPSASTSRSPTTTPSTTCSPAPA